MPPPHSAAELHCGAEPAQGSGGSRSASISSESSTEPTPPEVRKQAPAGKGRVRTVKQKKAIAAEVKRQEKAKEAGDLCCPVCAAVGTQKLFKGVPGIVGHLNNAHILLQMPVPEEFWRSQSVVRCCRVCRMAFANTGNRKHAVCGACRKLKLSEPLPLAPVVGSERVCGCGR